MSSSWSIVGLGVCSLACACATTGVRDRPRVARGAESPSGDFAASRGPAAVQPVEKTPPIAEQRRDRAEGLRTNELAAPAADDHFAVARQVAALERAVELYQAFIVRAGDDPQYAEAVRRSEGRIEDARLTICFLLEKPCEGGSEGK
jgi:hypothetical protein